MPPFNQPRSWDLTAALTCSGKIAGATEPAAGAQGSCRRRNGSKGSCTALYDSDIKAAAGIVCGCREAGIVSGCRKASIGSSC